MFTRNSRNRTRNSTNQIVHFFKFKKLQPKFHFCFLVAKRRWPGLLGTYKPRLFAFARMFAHFLVFSFAMHIIFMLLFFLSCFCSFPSL